MADLPSLRTRIDSLDSQLVNLLNERAQVSINIGLAKRKAKEIESGGVDDSQNAHVHIPAREIAVYERLKGLNHGPLTNEAVEAIYREIMSASISLQKEIVIAYLGPRGSYTQTAAYQRFGDSVAYSDQHSIQDVIDAVENKTVTYGVVPFENSTFGSVTQTLDAFINSNGVMIRAEHYMAVHHCLLSVSTLSAVKKVYSHPQALGQVSKWLQKHLPGIEKVSVASTSLAAEMAAKEPGTAAISNIKCAEIYHLKVLASNIEDQKENTTRFFVIGDSVEASTGNDKSLMYFTVDHRQPGALCDALIVLKRNNINLTKIDSRPSGQSPWHYFFLVEMTGHMHDKNVQEALKDMQQFCLHIRVLGSYPDQRPKDN
ncbi:hypothetical protein HDV05_004738 [Chytridiales sp. JEL 0842]|nr:hypothetical protein HDV05_004738 [Chytridiales sp. JEL 0842]